MKIYEFERIVDKTFWGLTNKHDFVKTETSLHKRGATVSFQNTTTEIILNYEIGSFPWITIADIKKPETDRVSLDWLLVELGEKKHPSADEAFFSAKMDEGQFEDEVQKKVDQLLKFGTVFFSGDFTLLPDLQKLAEDYLSECKKFANQKNTKS